MLGTLMKHEFKQTGRLLIPLNLILIAVTLLGALLLQIDLFEAPNLELVPAIFMLLYILSIIVLFILTAVYLMIRFYKTMYSSQGYLTHTLPVSTASILVTKILSAVFWLCTAFVITICSIWILIRSAAGNAWNPDAFSLLQDALMQSMGFSLGEFLCIAAVFILTAFLSMVLMIYASLAVGQLFRQNRIPFAIAAYIVFYIIQQIISVISLVILGITQIETIEQMHGSALYPYMGDFYQGLFAITIIQSIVFSIAYYLITLYISKKKLNLE